MTNDACFDVQLVGAVGVVYTVTMQSGPIIEPSGWRCLSVSDHAKRTVRISRRLAPGRRGEILMSHLVAGHKYHNPDLDEMAACFAGLLSLCEVMTDPGAPGVKDPEPPGAPGTRSRKALLLGERGGVGPIAACTS